MTQDHSGRSIQSETMRCNGSRTSSSASESCQNGGGGIRTRGRFPFAGFQDRSHQPLDHPSTSIPQPQPRHRAPFSHGQGLGGAPALQSGDFNRTLQSGRRCWLTFGCSMTVKLFSPYPGIFSSRLQGLSPGLVRGRGSGVRAFDASSNLAASHGASLELESSTAGRIRTWRSSLLSLGLISWSR